MIQNGKNTRTTRSVLPNESNMHRIFLDCPMISVVVAAQERLICLQEKQSISGLEIINVFLCFIV
jgi:hypothetical protein